jgi:hypothetical protein
LVPFFAIDSGNISRRHRNPALTLRRARVVLAIFPFLFIGVGIATWLRRAAKPEIDQSTYKAALDNAEASVASNGDFADAGKAVLAVVDSDSFRVKAYLEETKTILSSGMTATVRIKPKHESEEEDRPVFRESRAGRP